MDGQGKSAPDPRLESFLISLPGSARQGGAVTALARAGIAAWVIPADDGRSPAARRVYRAWRARLYCGRALAPAEVGCFLSHRIAAERFLAGGAAFGLVLEDDAAPVADMRPVLERLVRALPQSGWDVVNLGAAPAFLHRPIAPLDTGRQLVRAHYFPLTSHAVLWSRGGARRFLAATSHVFYPLDHFLRRWACQSGRGLALSEPLFRSRDLPSQIDSDGARAKLVNARGYRVRRALRRWRNKAWAARRAWQAGTDKRGSTGR